ncbi:MAG: lysoplasmalogenase [Clostridia bacterium]|nr:lysoplasmalogenase [Clostridia bacterium]
MQITYILLSVETASLIALLWNKNYQNKKRSLIFKSLTSLLFFYIAVHSFLFSGGQEIFAVFIITALLFCVIGDILICFIKRKFFFKLAGTSFFIGHVFYCIGFFYATRTSMIEIVILIVLWLLFPLSVKISKVALKKNYFLVFAYFILLSTMCVKSFSFLFYQSFGLSNAMMTAAGGLLFYISDIIIFFEKFQKETRRKLFIPNLITYYVGQTLIALSLLFI